jgi:hypothetical protein
MSSLKTFAHPIIALGFFLYAGCAPVHPDTAPPPPAAPVKDIEYFSPPKTVYVKDKSVNIRSGAGMQFDVLTSVKQGTALKVYSREEQWFNVQLADNNRGYIFMPLTSEYKPKIAPQPKAPGDNESDDQLPPPRKIEPVQTDPSKPNTIDPAEPVNPEAPAPAEPVPSNKVETPETGKSTKPPWLR